MTVLTQLLLLCLCACAYSTPLVQLHRRQSNYANYASDYARDYEPIVYAAIPFHGPVPVLQVLSRRPLAHAPTRQTPRPAHEPSVQHPVYARPPYQSYQHYQQYRPNQQYQQAQQYEDNDYAPSSNNEYEYDSTGYREPQQYRESQAHRQQLQVYREPQGYHEYREHTPYGDAYTYAASYPQQYAASSGSYPQQYVGVAPAALYDPTGEASQEPSEVTILYARPNPTGGFLYRKRPNKSTPKKLPVSTTDTPVIIRVHRYKVVRDV